MFVSIFISMIIMCFILGLEIIIEPKYNHRLTWPYGDQMPGSYLSTNLITSFLCYDFNIFE